MLLGQRYGTALSISVNSLFDKQKAPKLHVQINFRIFAVRWVYQKWSLPFLLLYVVSILYPINSYVYENRGRYSGCHAKWISQYTIEVEKPDKPIYQNIKISPSEVIKNFF